MKWLFIFLLLSPSVVAWDYEGHEIIAEDVYYSTDMQFKNFNLSRLKEGSIAPDKIFRDQRRHHYPNSFNLALLWLNNDSDASFNFGVASHYISDSFASPHYIKGEKYSDHALFEKQARSIYIECRNYGFDLENSLRKGSFNYKDWKPWLVSKSKSIPENEFNDAARLVLSVAIEKFNLSCLNHTQVQEVEYFDYRIFRNISIVLVLSLVFLYFLNH